jgi:hypothetical protein
MMRINCTRLIYLVITASIISLCNVAQAQETAAKSSANSDTAKFGSYRQMVGSKVANTKYGDLNIRVYTYLRYPNQMGLDSSYTDAFGETSSIDNRQDMQIQKVSIYFTGWFLDPKFQYFLYVWTTNASQGLGVQVVVAGNLTYRFNKYFIL